MENTVAKKIEALVKLQNTDSKLDEIKKIRGDLPEEVQDFEDEIAGYETRIGKLKQEIQEMENGISSNREGIKNAENMIKRYEEQQMNVRNNREYDAITKEMELQDLEIQILNKKIKEFYEQIGYKQQIVDETQKLLNERGKELENKRAELDVIISETEAEELKLMKDREKASKNIEDRLLNSYNKIRGNVSNGLAVVNVKRGACGGCFNMVPFQRQADIKEKKKIIVCEHCGRIFADVETIEEEEKTKKGMKKKTIARR